LFDEEECIVENGLKGDVNMDGSVDISDATMLINYLLSGNDDGFSYAAADVNEDGFVDISDATTLINYLLNGDWPIMTEKFTVNGVSFNMVTVDGGTFMMGATVEEDADYQVFMGSPKHQVALSSYRIGQTEVTQELWVAVMGSNPSADQSNLQYPVSNVNWNDCDTFITRLNALTGLQFRLPTEAEWEFAAQGGTRSKGYIYSGSDDLEQVAWINTNSDNHCHPVGTKKANELSLYDMNGNVEEWCHDWYSLYTEDPVVNPTGPETGTSRIHRGGRWSSGAKFCRITRRDGFAPTVIRNYMGFRLAL
jgi:formylglycine-generating enzyme required for sulfatase activity